MIQRVTRMDSLRCRSQGFELRKAVLYSFREGEPAENSALSDVIQKRSYALFAAC